MKIGANYILKGALLLGFATFTAKLLGAIYRSPLTNMIGGYGLGLYQMIFPVYAVLLDLSGAGLPTAMSKTISSYKGLDREQFAYTCLRKARRAFFIVGLFFVSILAICSKIFAGLQGNSNAYLGYLFLAPAILPVCMLSCYRGYFQGLLVMQPTALTQIIEQVFKLIFGLLFVQAFLPNIPLAVGGATLGITLSEVVALISIYIMYKTRRKKLNLNLRNNFSDNAKLFSAIIKVIIPVTITSILLPLSQVLDSFILINKISAYSKDATSLYGLLSGVALTIIGLPVALCYGIATVTIPSVSAVDNNKKDSLSVKSMFITMLFSLGFAILCYCFSKTIISILFSRLTLAEKNISTALLKILSGGIVLLSMLQTQNAILIAYGKNFVPSITLFFGVMCKIFINIFMASQPKFNIYAGAIGIIACYFVPCLINLIILFSIRVRNVYKTNSAWQFANR